MSRLVTVGVNGSTGTVYGGGESFATAERTTCRGGRDEVN
jgi:hypothetical protein